MSLIFLSIVLQIGEDREAFTSVLAEIYINLNIMLTAIVLIFRRVSRLSIVISFILSISLRIDDVFYEISLFIFDTIGYSTNFIDTPQIFLAATVCLLWVLSTISFFLFRRRGFEQVLLYVQLTAIIISSLIFHYITVSNGFVPAMEKRMNDNRAIFAIDLKKDDPKYICEIKNFNCILGNSEENNNEILGIIDNAPDFIKEDIASKQGDYAIKWAKYEKFSDIGIQLHHYIIKQGDMTLYLNDHKINERNTKRYFFMMYALLLAFNLFWFAFYIVLYEFHMQRFMKYKNQKA